MKGARNIAAVAVARLAAAVMVVVMATASLAQTAPQGDPPAAPPAAAPPVSADCQTPGITMAGDIPMANVMLALKDRKVIRILAIGASASGGREAGDNSYYGIIEGALEKTIPGVDVKIINKGISGELASDAAERMRTLVALVKPDLVLWQLGTHDALRQVRVDEFKTVVSDTLAWLRRHNVDVVIVGLHYLRRLADDPHYQAIRAALSQIGEEQKVLRIGRYEAMQVIEQTRASRNGPPPNEFSLTEDGYSCLAEYVARAVASGVFARKDPSTLKPRG